MRALRLSPLPLIVLSLAACGGDASAEAEAASSGSTTRDSAGVAIVESTAPAWGEGDAWAVAAAPSVDLGGEEAPEGQQWGGVADALRLSDGTVVVADELAREIRWLRPDGSLAARAGRKGSGPGEFTDIHALFRLAGDTLGAWDANLSRLTRHDAAGRMVDVRTLRPLRDIPSDLVGVLADGSPVMLPAFSRRRQAPGRDTIPYLRLAPDLARFDTLGMHERPEQAAIRSVSGRQRMTLWMPTPFAATTRHAVHADALYLGDDGRGAVTVVGGDGRVRRRIRTPFASTPLTEAEREAERNRLVGADGSKPVSASTREMAAQIPFPATKPGFAEMLVDGDGAVWLRAFTAPGAPQAWDVLAADGRLLGRMEMPPGLRVMEIGRDYVLGTWRDELDVTHVRVHPLYRTR